MYMDINDILDPIFSVPSALSGFGGMLISLLAYKFSYLGKKGWLGNDCSVWIGIACVLLAMVLIAFRLFWFIPCILLLPVVACHQTPVCEPHVHPDLLVTW